MSVFCKRLFADRDSDELEQVIDDFLVYPIKLLEDQWTTAWEKYGVKVKVRTAPCIRLRPLTASRQSSYVEGVP